MNTNKTPSKALTMKIDRTANTIEIQWDRKIHNTEYILNNLKMFGIEATPDIARQIINLSIISAGESNKDLISI